MPQWEGGATYDQLWQNKDLTQVSTLIEENTILWQFTVRTVLTMRSQDKDRAENSSTPRTTLFEERRRAALGGIGICIHIHLDVSHKNGFH